jgi:hypothetical protein
LRERIFHTYFGLQSAFYAFRKTTPGGFAGHPADDAAQQPVYFT